MNRKYVYVSGKFTDEDEERVLQNIRRAYEVFASLVKLGFIPISPINMTVYPDKGREAGFNWDRNISYEEWLKYDIELLKLCDYILMLPSWVDSKGSRREREEAAKLGIEIVYSIEELLVKNKNGIIKEGIVND